MTSFSYALPVYRFKGATDLNGLTVSDYNFLAHFGAYAQPYSSILASNAITRAQENHAKSLFLRRLEIRQTFEGIKGYTKSMKLAESLQVENDEEQLEEKKRMIEHALKQIDRLRTLWCNSLADYLCGVDVFIFMNSLSDEMYDEDARMSMEEVFSERLEMARDALQEMVRMSQPSTQLGDWMARKVYIDDDFILHWII